MAEYLIQDTTLDAIADAINAKTGGSTAMTPAQMVTAIGTISGGGGGSLPSVITKIDGGVFTPVNDIAGTLFWLSHNLGVVPKGIVVWTDDNDLLTSTAEVSQKYLLCSSIEIISWVTGTTSNGAIPNHLFRNTTGATSNTGSPIPLNTLSNYFTSTQFNNAVPSIYYKAGVQYKWLAWT